MSKYLHALVALALKRNLASTPKEVILDQMLEPRPLPMGRKEFETWSDRIISGAVVPGGKDDPIVFRDTLKWTLANLLMHLGPTESHKPDAFFIHSLRKMATNQVADEIRKEFHAAAKARTAAEEANVKKAETRMEALNA